MSLDNSAVVPFIDGAFEIDQSLRFNDNDSTELSRNMGSGGNRKTWTWSFWVKRADKSNNYHLLNATSIAQEIYIIYFQDDGSLRLREYYAGGNYYMDLITDRRFRDLSAWYHFVIVMDTTQSTASNRVKVYVNGEQETSFTTSTYPSQNRDMIWNSARTHYYGDNVHAGLPAQYLAEVHWVDGQALDPTYFGETDEDYGHWKPIRYSGTHGTTGYYLNFSDSGSIGADSSGNGNNWTATNFSSTDVVLDSPSNNFATISHINGSGDSISTISEGGLRLNSDSTNWARHPASMHCYAGTGQKYYCEVLVNQRGNNAVAVGGTTADIRESTSNQNSEDEGSRSIFVVAYFSGYGPLRLWTGSYSNISTTVANGGIIGMALDPNTRNIKFYYNGSQVGNSSGYTISTDSTTGSFCNFQFFVRQESGDGDISINFGQDSSFAGQKTAQGNTDANGIGDFYYTPPSGYLALCSKNLPDPIKPKEHFNTLLWSGNGSSRTISGVGFQPGFVWLKQRTSTEQHYVYDALRGANYYLHTNLDSAEGYSTSRLTGFTSDGFTLSTDPAVNGSGHTYVSWNLKASGSAVSNTDGSITSSVIANTDAGFSIIEYDSNGNGSVGHGLNKTPEICLYKRTDSSEDWVVYNTLLSTGTQMYYLMFNGTGAGETTGANNFTSTTIPGYTSRDIDIVAYAFHSVDGFSKFGSYVGNGSSSHSAYVYTGFRPEFLIIKLTTASGYYWVMHDAKRNTYNYVDNILFPNHNYSESVNFNEPQVDFLSNGFKIRSSYRVVNGDGDRYLYMAFAETPFKYANAR